MYFIFNCTLYVIEQYFFMQWNTISVLLTTCLRFGCAFDRYFPGLLIIQKEIDFGKLGHYIRKKKYVCNITYLSVGNP